MIGIFQSDWIIGSSTKYELTTYSVRSSVEWSYRYCNDEERCTSLIYIILYLKLFKGS